MYRKSFHNNSGNSSSGWIWIVLAFLVIGIPAIGIPIMIGLLLYSFLIK